MTIKCDADLLCLVPATRHGIGNRSGDNLCMKHLERAIVVNEIVEYVRDSDEIKDRIEACLRAQVLGEREDLLVSKFRLILSREIASVIVHSESGCTMRSGHNSYCNTPGAKRFG